MVSTQKFLCIMPLDIGVICLAYFCIFGSSVQFLTVTLLNFLCYYCVHIVWPMHFCLYLFLMVLSVMLIVGIKQKKILLVKIYFCSLFVYILLMVLLLLLDMIFYYYRNWMVFVLTLETVILTACLFGVKAYLENQEKTVVNGEVYHAEYKRHPVNPNVPHASAPIA